MVKCKSQLLDNGDGADLFHSSFILRMGGGGDEAGFAGGIAESRWIIHYGHCWERVVWMSPKRVFIRGKHADAFRSSQQVTAVSLLSSPAQSDAHPAPQPALSRSRSHVSWKINRL